MRKLVAYALRADRKDSGYKTSISDSLENLQAYVGGYIEAVGVAPDVCVICNEEGRLRELPYNCNILGYDFFGDILIVGVKEEDFDDLPPFLQNVKHLREVLGVR